MYVIEPLYSGDISVESTFENGKITHLVYDLDDTWNGDMLVAGTDVFIVGGKLLDLMKLNLFKGFTLKDIDISYHGTKILPDFMQLLPEETLKIIRNEYFFQTENDIYLTQNVGEVAVSNRLFECISQNMDKDTFTFHEIYFKDDKETLHRAFKYEYIIITACSTPFDLLPSDIKKHSLLKNGTYIINSIAEDVYVSAPYLDCLRQFDIDTHSYMDIYDPYFLVVNGNDKMSVKEVIKSMCSRDFYIAESFSEQFVKCLDFMKNN